VFLGCLFLCGRVVLMVFGEMFREVFGDLGVVIFGRSLGVKTSTIY
jgi:hypothetical protein